MPDLDRRLGLSLGGHRQEAARFGHFTPHPSTDLLGHVLRENARPASLPETPAHLVKSEPSETVDFVRILTGQQRYPTIASPLHRSRIRLRVQLRHQ